MTVVLIGLGYWIHTFIDKLVQVLTLIAYNSANKDCL